jgi:hypothetical protein
VVPGDPELEHHVVPDLSYGFGIHGTEMTSLGHGSTGFAKRLFLLL